MNSKLLIYLALFIGSTIGSYIPEIWGAGLFSLQSIISGAIGGFVGIWIGYKLNQRI